MMALIYAAKSNYKAIQCWQTHHILLLKTLAVLCLLINVLLVPAHANNLPTLVQQELKKAGVPESAIGVYVHEIGADKPTISVNAETAMNPASVMKLVTTFAGLELLGPAYSWQTKLYANGIQDNGVVHGDLVIKGYGDPKLDLENFWLLTNRLRQTGLREITGDLILDHSHFDIPQDDPGAFDGQPYRTYNVLPEALLVNYRTSVLHFIPQPESNAVHIVVDPLPESLLVDNGLTLTKEQCRSDWRRLLGINVQTNDATNNSVVIKLNGSYSINCGKRSYPLGLHDSSTYTRDLFKLLWEQQGGIFQGNVINGTTPSGASLIKTYQSPPLAEIIRGINKFSNNIAARQLYLTLGAAASNTRNQSPATLAKSDHAIRQWLTSKQLYFPELIIENGSGLSRISRISAEHVGKLLLAAFQSPVMPELLSSMPIAAVDGTMRNRLHRTPVSGLAHIKTGSLNEVRAIAGYMLNKDGKRFVVVFLVNHPKAVFSRTAMDILLQSLY